MKKRVLILIGIPNFNYSNEKSAVCSYLIEIKNGLLNQGYEVEFALDSESASNSPQPTNSAGNSLSGIIKKTLKKWPWLYYSLQFRTFFKKQDLIEQQLLEGKPFDLIIEFHTAGSRIGARLAKKWNAQLSVIFDSPVDEQFLEMHGTKSMHWRRICETEKETLQAAHRIMCYSPACKEHVLSKYSPTAEFNILPSLLNKPLDYQRKDSDTFNIGFIGSFLSWYRLDMTIDVFKKFNQKYPDSRLQLIGFGVEWPRLKAKVESLGLGDIIDIPGFVSEEELSQYKSEFSIGLQPGSNWYGSPLKLFEYAQGGIPFVAPVSKTVRSVFTEGEHCLYVKEGEEFESLYTAIEFYYLNVEKRKEYGLAAQALVQEKFSKEVYQKKLADYLGFK